MAQSPLTPEQIDKLAALAGKRLGTTPEQLKAIFQQQGLAGVAALTGQTPDGLTPEETRKATKLMENREQAAALLEDPRIQGLLKQLLGGQ